MASKNQLEKRIESLEKQILLIIKMLDKHQKALENLNHNKAEKNRGPSNISVY
jgi:prefoldin subunit 5